jgi:hypothetical protein
MTDAGKRLSTPARTARKGKSADPDGVDGRGILPEWVTLDRKVDCIILAARLNHEIVLDEAGAQRLIRYVPDALDRDSDNTLDSRRPFAFWIIDGQFEEIDYFVDYRVNWRTWQLTWIERPLWGEPSAPSGRVGNLAVRRYKFEEAVEQAVHRAGLVPFATPGQPIGSEPAPTPPPAAPPPLALPAAADTKPFETVDEPPLPQKQQQAAGPTEDSPASAPAPEAETALPAPTTAELSEHAEAPPEPHEGEFRDWTTTDLDDCIDALAARTGGKTDRDAVRHQGPPLLKARRIRTGRGVVRALEMRFNDPKHSDKRRGHGDRKPPTIP